MKKRLALAAILAFLITAAAPQAGAVYLPTLVDLANPVNARITGIDGAASEDLAGTAVTGGDINGDGFDDVVVGAYKASGGRGVTYVLFGSGGAFDTSRIDLAGTAQKVAIIGKGVLDWSGFALAVGDVNHDGRDDIIIGAYRSDPGGRINAGEVYVVMGATDFQSRGTIDLSVTSSGVVTISGDDNEDNAGYSVAAGDVNGDNYDDVIIGAYRGDPSDRIDAGEAYAVFGAANFSSRGTIDLGGTPSGVLRINGEDTNDLFGTSAAAADIDNDGDCEIIIGAPNAYDNKGAAYVIPGSAALASQGTLDVAGAVAGMTVVYGGGATDHLGDGVAAGNLDGDAFSDVIINIPRAGLDGGLNQGKTAVLFGSATFGDTGRVSLPGFLAANLTVFYWETPAEGLRSVSAGDLNGDGFDDMIIGVRTSSPGGRTEAGKTVIIYGAADIDTVPLINMQYPVEGMAVINGGIAGDGAGSAVAALDYNGDGVEDLVLGVPGADTTERTNNGAALVLKGYDTTEIIAPGPMDGAYANRDTAVEGFFNTDMGSYTVVVSENGSAMTPDSLYTGPQSMYFKGWRDFTAGSDVSVSITGQNAAGDAVAFGWDFHIKTDETPPHVLEHTPLSGEVNVARDADIVITFSGDVDPDSTTVTVMGAAGEVTTVESWADSVLTLTHTASFALNGIYSVTVDAGDEYGDRDEPMVWTFAVRPETTPPWFTVTVPGESGGYIPQDAIIRLAFPADVDKPTVAVSLEGTLTGIVPGAWTWAETTYTFTPAGQYTPGETLVLTAGASDIHRNATGDSLFTFFVKPDIVPPSVVSRSPAPGAVNVPVAMPVSIGFTQDIHPDSTTITVTSARSGTVSCTRSWVDYTAVLSHTAAFAAGDTITVNVDAGDEYGNRAMFTWSFITRPDEVPPRFKVLSPVNVSAVSRTDVVTLAFPVDVDKQEVTAAIVGNIAGSIPGAWSWADTLYRFNHSVPFTAGDSMILTVSAADIYGNAITDSTVVMYVRPDETPPSILTRTPAPGAVNVAPDAPVTIGFSADAAPDSTTFTMTSAIRGTIAVTAAWTGSEAVLSHTTDFALSDTVTVAVSACDAYTNRQNYTWQFMTRPDSTPPDVTVQTPGNPMLMNSHDPLTFVFSGDIDRAAAAIAITDGGGSPVNGAWSWADSIYTFTPVPSFAPGASITCRINAADIYGNSIPETVRQFAVKPEEIPPEVLDHSPAADSLNVPLATPVVIHFNHDVYPDSTTVVLFSDQRTSITVSKSWSDSTLTLTPTQQWRQDESVTVALSASDRYGNRLRYNWMFGTGATAASAYYQIVVPGERTEMARNATISIEFDDRVDIATAQAVFSGSASGPLAGTTVWDGRIMTFTPSSLMAAGEIITITVTARDTAGAEIPVAPETATVGLHTPWIVITGVTLADSSEMVHRIDFTTNDPDGSYMVTRNWQYRIGAGAWTTISADRIDLNTSRPPGAQAIIWRPTTALRGVYTGAMSFRMEAYDGRYTSGQKASAPFLFDWNSPPSVTVTGGTVDYGHEKVSFNFAITDAERDSVSLAYEYSTDGGMTWTAGTPDRSLAKLPLGSYSGKFGWNYLDGLQTGVEYTGFMARLIPSDYKTGLPAQSAAVVIDLNAPPAAVIDDLFTPQSGDVELTYHLADAEHDTLSLACFYSTDGGSNWEETTHVAVDSTITVYDGVLTWSSKEDLPSIESFNTRFRIVPSDADPGTVAATGAFQLINNSPPSLAFSLPDTAAKAIQIPVAITDLEHDPVTIHAAWKISGEADWRTVSILSNLSDIQPAAYNDTLLWDSRSDTGEAFIGSAVLKLTVTDAHNDIGDSSTRSVADTLSIDNERPRIAEITGYADGDTVYVRYSEPVTAGATEAARYSLSPDITIDRVIAGASAAQYMILLESALPRMVQVNLAVTGITDLRGNIAEVLGASFAPLDDNTNPVVALGSFPSELSGDVSVAYTITDPEGDTISLTAEYSLDDGQTWLPATISGAVSGIGQSGYNGAFVWHSAADVPGIEITGVRLRVMATDSQTGEPAVSPPFRLDNNQPPGVTIGISDPDSIYSGPVTLTYDIDEPEQDFTELHITYSIDDGAIFQPATLTGLGLILSMGTYHGAFVWHTETDLPGSFARALLVAQANDDDPGVPDSLWVWVDNYGAPRITAVMPEGEQAGDITVQFQVADPHGGPVTIRGEYSIDGGTTWQSAMIEGGQISGPSGYNGQLMWRSSSHLAGFEGTAQLKLTPVGGIEGIYDIGAVAVDYNQPPSVAVDPPGDEISGDVGFVCHATDEERDVVAIDVEFSIDGGQTWYEAGITGNTDVPGDGSPHTVTWNSMDDMPNRETKNLMVRFRARDADPGAWTTLGPLHLDNNLPPTVSISLAHPDSIMTESADIGYQIDDAERNMVSLTATYSTDGGATYNPATVTGAVTGIFSSAYDGSLRWELGEDIASGAGAAIFKLFASDEDPGPADTLTVRYNTYGVCTVALSAPSEEYEGDVPIGYIIDDAKGNTVNLTVEFSINKFGIWQPAAVAGALTGITPAGYDGEFTWLATHDIAGFQGMAKLRVTPDNGGGGVPSVTEFPVDNNIPPSLVSVTLDTTQVRAGNILITYRGTDNENDPFTVSLAYSTDGGATFTPATTTGGAAVRPGVNGLITWLSSADIGYGWQQRVRLALTPSDGDPGAAFPAGPVTVTNLAGDFNYDLRIDGNDLPLFVDAWNKQDVNRDIGPATGAPPELVPVPDGSIDFEDLAVFVWMWNWYSSQSEKYLPGPEQSPAKPAAGEESMVTLMPDADGLLRIVAACPIDFLRIVAAPGCGVRLSMPESGYWDAHGEGVILSRNDDDGTAELAAARFGEIPSAPGLSVGMLQIEGGAGDVAMTISWRKAGEETVHSGTMTVQREDISVAPDTYALGVNVPNPFNPYTTITYSLPIETRVRLTIYNSAGQVVCKLCDGLMSAGMHSVVWDASGVPSGVYFYRMLAGPFSATRKMLLLK